MDRAHRTTEKTGGQILSHVGLTTGEAAEILGLRTYQLSYLIKSGQIPTPRKTLLGRKLFYLKEDLEEIQEKLRSRPKHHADAKAIAQKNVVAAEDQRSS